MFPVSCEFRVTWIRKTAHVLFLCTCISDNKFVCNLQSKTLWAVFFVTGSTSHQRPLQLSPIPTASRTHQENARTSSPAFTSSKYSYFWRTRRGETWKIIILKKMLMLFQTYVSRWLCSKENWREASALILYMICSAYYLYKN